MEFHGFFPSFSIDLHQPSSISASPTTPSPPQPDPTWTSSAAPPRAPRRPPAAAWTRARSPGRCAQGRQSGPPGWGSSAWQAGSYCGSPARPWRCAAPSCPILRRSKKASMETRSSEIVSWVQCHSIGSIYYRDFWYSWCKSRSEKANKAGLGTKKDVSCCACGSSRNSFFLPDFQVNLVTNGLSCGS